jgi:hypothetical protein
LQRERRADYGQRPSSRPRNAPATRRAEIGHSDHPRLTTTLPLLRCPSIQSASTSTFLWSLSSKAIHYRTKRLSDHRIHILPHVEMRTLVGCSPCSRTGRGSNLRLHVSHVAWRRLPLPSKANYTFAHPLRPQERADASFKTLAFLFYQILQTHPYSPV